MPGFFILYVWFYNIVSKNPAEVYLFDDCIKILKAVFCVFKKILLKLPKHNAYVSSEVYDQDETILHQALFCHWWEIVKFKLTLYVALNVDM